MKRHTYQGKPLILHEDHRWVLPIVERAQTEGLLPKPAPVILFDRHTDAAEPGRLAHAGDIVAVCERDLSPHDDDWIVAGVQLGLLADVLIFGVDDRMNELPKRVGDHVIMGRYAMPAKATDLGSRARELLDSNEPILLDIDLDCFAYAYRDRVLAWDDGIFAAEFGPSLPHFQTFAARAGMITVCREAGCCGGEENADRIWALARRYLFSGGVTDSSAEGP